MSQSYNNVEDIWKFKLEKLEIRDDFFRESSNLCLLVARNATNNPVEDPPVQEEKTKRGGRGNRR